MNVLNPFLLDSFALHSRVCKSLRLSNKNTSVFIKRDDELSAMISGSKYRKYATLIPFLLKNEIDSCFMIGSSFSNNLVGLAQMLLENNIDPYALILKSQNELIEGNHLFIKMLLPSSSIYEISRDMWPKRMEIAKKLSSHLSNCLILDEGCKHSHAMLGSMTLGFDILENQRKLGLSFDQIFLDCGTGGSAIGFLLSLNFIGINPKVHIVSMTMEKEAFHHEYLSQLKFIEKLLDKPLQHYEYTFSKPTKYKSFGATSPDLFRSLINIVRSDGIFFDPIYSLKLYLEAEKILKTKQSVKNALVVHSGGCLSLAGFQEKLRKVIEHEEPHVYSNSSDHSHK